MTTTPRPQATGKPRLNSCLCSTPMSNRWLPQGPATPPEAAVILIQAKPIEAEPVETDASRDGERTAAAPGPTGDMIDDFEADNENWEYSWTMIRERF